MCWRRQPMVEPPSPANCRLAVELVPCNDLFGLVPERKEPSMKDLGKWWLAHTIHWAVLYGAFFAEIEGAMYVLKFGVWVLLPLSLLSTGDKVAADAAKSPPKSFRAAASTLQAWCTLGLLVWFGHIATAVAWGVVMVMVAVYRDKTRKARAVSAASAARRVGRTGKRLTTENGNEHAGFD